MQVAWYEGRRLNFELKQTWAWIPMPSLTFMTLNKLLKVKFSCLVCKVGTVMPTMWGRQWHPLQYFCLENLMDGGAWWAAIYGVARVGHDWATSLSLFTFMHWRRKWQPTPVFLPGESQGWGSLVGCHLWGQSQTRLKWLSSSSSNAHYEGYLLDGRHMLAHSRHLLSNYFIPPSFRNRTK